MHLSGLAGAHPYVRLKETLAEQCFSRHSRSRSRGEGSGGFPPMDILHLLDIMQGHVQGNGITSQLCPPLPLYLTL